MSLYEGIGATEMASRSVRSPNLLQFATHGYTLSADPSASGWDNPLLRSMLILAGWNRWRPEDSVFYRVRGQVLSAAEYGKLKDPKPNAERIELPDGVLTAYEVTGLDLRGTELVNLTACETGVGQVTAEGVVGLRQAFLLAGARSLTMSLWSVPSAETTEQMKEFYGRWLGEGSKGARYGAFRASQLSALAKARTGYGAGHPFYWAGVVYAGDPGDLPPVNAASGR